VKTERVQALTTTFEAYAQQTESGIEFWLARDLRHLLGYTKWDNFLNVVSKAKTACEVTGHAVSDHFADVGKTTTMPKGAEKFERPRILELGALQSVTACNALKLPQAVERKKVKKEN